uniref:Uncharacterized protein n=1 Tax=Vespula pensylvanica TaxID=30213 RepID=A0A834UAY9_VESPE|nr:hypothetical protein H0235_006791 [Vespula pensylvanica]
MSDGIAGAIAISLFGSDHSILCLRFGDEKKRRDSMDTAGYSVLSNDDVCRMFDQYSYKHRQEFGALFEGRTLLDSIRTTRNVSLERRSIIGPMKGNVTLIFLTTVNLLLQFAEVF